MKYNNKKILISLGVILFVLLIVFFVFRIIRNSSTYKYEGLYIYNCSIDGIDEVLEINGIKYRSIEYSSGDSMYDDLYVLDNKLYERGIPYAYTKVNTPCDDWTVYTVKDLDPEQYVIKVGHDYTGYYDGSLYERVNEEND
jgi:hypothetical protein